MHFLKPTSEFTYISFTRSVKFLGQSIIVKYTYGTLVWISPLDHAHFGQGIIVVNLILVDFDGCNANITLKNCIDVVYIHVYAVYKF